MGEKYKVVPITTQREFGGVIGATLMTITLPIFVYLLNFMCSKESCTIQKFPRIPTHFEDYFDLNATLIFLGWMIFQFMLAALPIGRFAEGLPIRSTGKKLIYRCNGFHAFIITLVSFFGLVYMDIPVSFVYKKFFHLATTSIIFSCILSIILYVKAKFVPNHEKSPGGNSGYISYDFFMGHELNPQFLGLDLKFICELRPGLIGWAVLNLCFIIHSFELNNSPNYALIIVSVYHIWYVADALWFEEAILTTMDITDEGFGFMLCFGDLAWVPFTHTLSTRFLLEHPQEWPLGALVAMIFLKVAGYTIFRGSNSQKNDFRKNPRNPSVSHLKTMPTNTGKRLLISGWWGLCRHPNYLGDVIMAFSWSIPCGFQHILPYFYAVYLTILLTHRELRDEEKCHKKYGASWERYCEKVKYRIFPYIY